MKIKPEVEVFDDIDYCNEPDDFCSFLSHMTNVPSVGWCDLYHENLRKKNSSDGIEKKCDKCKADYLKAKREEPTDIIVIDGYHYDCIEERLYHPDGKIYATLICDDTERLEFVNKFKELKDMSVSTHEGLFNHIGMVLATDMFPSANHKMSIGIVVVVGKSF